MAIWKGPITARRYRLVLPPPVENATPSIPQAADEVESLWSLMRSRVEARAFTTPARPVPGEKVSGWTLPDNWLDTDFEDETRWRWNPLVALGLRIDRFEIPNARIKARVDQRVRAFCRERGVERCPAAIKRQITDEVEHELTAHGRWKTKTVEVAWDASTDTVWAGTTTESAGADLKKLWSRTFGDRFGKLEEWGPLPRVGEAQRPAEHFLAFLLHASEQRDGKLDESEDGTRTMRAGDRIGLAGGIDSNRVVVRGDSAPGSAEARRAIVRQKLPIELAVESRNEDDESVFTAVLKGGLPDLSGLRFTVPAGHDRFGEDLVRERMFLLAEAWFDCDRWGTAFAGVDDAGFEEVLVRMRAWAADDPIDEAEASNEE
jgi:hypothetical protein